MRPNLIQLAKVYIGFFGLFHYSHVFSLLGINETVVSAPPYLSLWWWHMILFLIFVVLPVVTVFIDSYLSYLTVTIVSLAGFLTEAFRVFMWTTDFHLMQLSLYSLAAILSLILAMQKIASRLPGEILSLTWSQF